jgi:hypothetical protein
MKELFAKCLNGPWVKSGDDVHYRLEREADRITLAFPGTWDEHGWWHNFDFAVTLYKGMKVPFMVHKGFASMYHSVRDEIMGRIGDEVNRGARFLVILGYSQGGALAALAHEDAGFRFNGLDVSSVSFAAPKVLFAPRQEIKDRFKFLTRYAAWGDPVPMVPPWFTHVGVGKMIGPFSAFWPWNHEPDYYARHLL